MALIKCKKCGKEISDRAEMCPACGYKTNNQTIICEECGTVIEEGINACPNCGCPIDYNDSIDIDKQEENKNAYSQKQDVNNAKKKSNSGKIIGASIAVIVVIVAIFMLFNGGDTSNSDANVKSNFNNMTVKKVDEMSAADFYKYLGELSEGSDIEFSVSEDAYNFISEYPEFFPGNEYNIDAMTEKVDYSVMYKHLDKCIGDYDDQMVKFSGCAIDVRELYANDRVYTYIHGIYNDEFDTGYDCSFIALYNGKCDVYIGDIIECFMVPLAKVSFENMEAEYTSAILGAGAYICVFSEEADGI